MQESQVSLGTMNEAELRDVIEGPPKALGASVDPELTKKLIRDIGLDPASGRSDEYDIGKLPLLEYALEQAWAKRTGPRIGLANYSGLEQALEERANALYGRLSAEEQAAAKRLFVSLVTPGEGREDTRARIDMPDDAAMRRVIQTFAGGEARLIVTDEAGGRRSVEVSHEALIRHWDKLRAWIDENRENLRTREFLKTNRAEWLKHGRDPACSTCRACMSRRREASMSSRATSSSTTSKTTSRRCWTTSGSVKKRKQAKQRQELEAARRGADERARSEEKERGLRKQAESAKSQATADARAIRTDGGGSSNETAARSPLSTGRRRQQRAQRSRRCRGRRARGPAIDGVELAWRPGLGARRLEAMLGTPWISLPCVIGLIGHVGCGLERAYSPDGGASCRGLRTNARLWDAATGAPIARRRHGPVTGALYSPDGRRILSWSR